MTRTKLRSVSAACIALALGATAAAVAQAQEYEQPPTAKPAGCPQTGLLVAGTSSASSVAPTSSAVWSIPIACWPASALAWPRP